MSGAIKNNVVQSTLSNASIGEMRTDVKLLGEIISVFSPQNELLYSSSTRGRMDPAGLELTSATWTECYVPITPRALSAVPVAAWEMARSKTTILPGMCQIGRASQTRKAWSAYSTISLGMANEAQEHSYFAPNTSFAAITVLQWMVTVSSTFLA
jgi:hypothetical protein